MMDLFARREHYEFLVEKTKQRLEIEGNKCCMPYFDVEKYKRLQKELIFRETELRQINYDIKQLLIEMEPAIVRMEHAIDDCKTIPECHFALIDIQNLAPNEAIYHRLVGHVLIKISFINEQTETV